jgi:hypothetical protein
VAEGRAEACTYMLPEWFIPAPPDSKLNRHYRSHLLAALNVIRSHHPVQSVQSTAENLFRHIERNATSS